MEKRAGALRPVRGREFDTGQMYQEWRMADLTRETGTRQLFTPDTKVYLSSRPSVEGTQYTMVFGKPVQKRDLHALFSNYSSGIFVDQGIAPQLSYVHFDEALPFRRDIALMKDTVENSDDTTLAKTLETRLTSIEYCWNAISGNRRYVKDIEKEAQSEMPNIVLVDHANGLAEVMRKTPEYWKKGTPNRNIANATVVRALSRLAQLDESRRRAVFEKELGSLPVDRQDIERTRRSLVRFGGTPLLMGNGKIGILANSGAEEITDMDGGLYRIKHNGQEVVVNLIGEEKHFADIYPQNERFVVPSVTWSKNKTGIRKYLFSPISYFGPNSIEETSSDERIRILRNFSGWQLSPMAGLLNIGYAGRYTLMGKAETVGDILQSVGNETVYMLNNPLIEKAESLAAFK